MKGLRDLLKRSPLVARVAPFVVFVALTALQGRLGPASAYWIYAAKTVVGIFLVYAMWPLVPEMRWAISWEAVVVGIGIFLFWVFLDPFYSKWGKIDSVWNPFAHFGANAPVAWFFVMVRILGSGFVVPPLEETFYRSFVYRYIITPKFEEVPLAKFHWPALLVTSALFGAAHYQWLAGILCGLAYQGLVLKKNRLGDAITAHAITNILLGVWVLCKNQWHFW
jgi:CAAX prenyl protease-like protein